MAQGAKIKLSHLSIHFNRTFKKCEGGDYDRKLFVAMYNNLVEAIEEFYSLEIRSPIIAVGFNEIYEKKFDELKDLEQSLEARKMI
ncbi:hypothetical protein [Cohnella silvisoli]|uniref:Uncharacterized protein n=1 Tax=Cohnella silvisoli TaxID=2873699 RepID=A0ABV1KZS7_9BACL|nr:hypothetical protein [Cohnella silvisoli]MCD9024335.1 hypothetical protein [Cohnella silvisoli]